jgi:hypothetical protein
LSVVPVSSADLVAYLGRSATRQSPARISGTRANIDHRLVGPGGVFIIDAKRYRG